jgi:hypothetical protein
MRHTQSKPARILVFIFAIAFLPLLLLAAEKKIDLAKLPPAATQTGLTFDKDVKPLIETTCLKCHSGKRPKGRFSVENREAFLKGGGSDEAAIVPGSSEKSPLLHYVADLVPEMEMPPIDDRQEYPPLTRDQIAILRAWIDQGAK